MNCPYDDPGCDQDDWEFMCESCRQDRAEEYREAMMDTYD